MNYKSHVDITSQIFRHSGGCRSSDDGSGKIKSVLHTHCTARRCQRWFGHDLSDDVEARRHFARLEYLLGGLALRKKRIITHRHIDQYNLDLSSRTIYFPLDLNDAERRNDEIRNPTAKIR